LTFVVAAARFSTHSPREIDARNPRRTSQWVPVLDSAENATSNVRTHRRSRRSFVEGTATVGSRRNGARRVRFVILDVRVLLTAASRDTVLRRDQDTGEHEQDEPDRDENGTTPPRAARDRRIDPPSLSRHSLPREGNQRQASDRLRRL